MKVVLFAWEGRCNASARCRIFDLAAWLRRRGVDASVEPPAGDRLSDLLGRPGALRRPRRALLRAVQLPWRHVQVRRAAGADVAILQRELFPFGAPSLERKLLAARRPVIFDVDDALHIRPAHFRTATHRLHDFGKAGEIARGSKAVVVSSAELAVWAEGVAQRVVRIPTAVDTARLRPAPRAARATDAPSGPVVGWSGTAGNLAHLESIRPALAEAYRRIPFRLRIVGEARPRRWSGPPEIDFVRWTLAGEAAEISRFDVGLMPLIDSPYARAKAGYKALTYMSCGVPAIVSPVGTNREILDDGIEGFFAASPEEWTERIVTLLRDEDLRRGMGVRGRARVERSWSQDVLFPLWLDLIREIAG